MNSSAKAVLEADITLNENLLNADGSLNTGSFDAWTPIGTSSVNYKGTFDGQGHTIKGLYYNNTNSTTGKNVGLFGYVSGATIQNVKIEEANISAYQNVGGICGYATNSTISSCSVSGTLNGSYTTSNTGGICGYALGTSKILNCSVAASITAKANTGGICGYAAGTSTIEKCYSTGKVTGTVASTGGICGNASATNAKVQITNCYSLGDVKGSGICGAANASAVIKNCYNAGTLIGSGAQISPSGAITNCYYVNDLQNMNGGMPLIFFNNGTVCDLLNEAEQNVWHQNGDYPDFTGEGARCDHSGLADHELCPTCGYQKQILPPLVEGYYLISQAYQLYWFANEVNVNKQYIIKGKLMNNITLDNTVQWKPIGGTTSATSYTGTFDGQGYTIKDLYYSDSKGSYIGLFGYVNGATIQNVKVVGASITASSNVGGICGYANGKTTISKCSFEGSIAGSSNVGGICGNAYASTVKVTNCYSLGDVKGSGICGAANASAVIKNCYNAGTLTGSGAQISPSGAITNCYYVNDLQNMNGGMPLIFFNNGTVCDLLNGDEQNVWHQNGNYPDFTGDGAHCDHSGLADHEICSTCGYQKQILPPSVEDYYLISQLYQLYWFANEVNVNKQYSIKGKLMNNITLDNSVQWKPIGGTTSATSYTGTFDGQGYTIKDLYYSDSKGSYVGLFGYVNGATIQNVKVVGASITASSNVGGICGYANGKTTISKCSFEGSIAGSSNVGGICGNASATNAKVQITNCYNIGEVRGSGICGAANASAVIKNCYNAGTLSGSGAQISPSGAITNCYYVNYKQDLNGGMPIILFNNGTVCDLLNGDEQNVWHQNGNYPDFTGDGAHCDHSGLADHEICSTCGYQKQILPPSVEDYYLISQAYQLYWFANEVNVNKKNTINGKLTDNIVLESAVQWTPIGSSSINYKGTFDGQGHTIKGLNIENSSLSYAGLFGYINTATIQNVKIEEAYISANQYVGGICGYAAKGTSTSNISECSTSGTVTGKTYVGGILGYATVTSIDKCFNLASIEQTGSNNPNAAGICGYADASIVINNCYNCGAIKNSYSSSSSSKSICSGICGGSASIQISNCYNVGTLSAQQVFGICNDDTKATNCYYLIDGLMPSDNPSGKTIFQFKSGEVCWLLNGESKEGVWKQSEGEPYPSFVGEETHYTKCIEHHFVNGLCSNCGIIQEADYDEEVYTVANLGQLQWIASKVNAGSGEPIKIKQTANITFNDKDSESKIIWTPIGLNDHPFAGEFNGQGFSISGLYFDNTNVDYVGFIGVVKSGKIEDIHIKDSYFAGKDYVGGVVGCFKSSEGSVSKCSFNGTVTGNKNVGGICGSSAAKVSNCYNLGTIKGSGSVAGIAGFTSLDLEVSNCFNLGIITPETCQISEKFENCYYLADKEDLCGGKSISQFKSGQVCWLLNHGSENNIWKQSAGEVYPSFAGDDVNYSLCTEHHFENGYCSVCATRKKPVMSDGFYLIADIYDLNWFSDTLATMNVKNANARLVENIVINENVISSVKSANTSTLTMWSPMCTNKDFAYKGTFDGNNKTISGLYCVETNKKAGLFANVGGNGANVKNLTITDAYVKSNTTAGGIIACCEAKTISNCSFSGIVESDASAGGICGSIGISDDVIELENCSNFGTINGKKNAGGICGECAYSSNFRKCSNYGDIMSEVNAGGISGKDNKYTTIYNSYNRGAVSATNAGGLIGNAFSALVVNSYNTGAIQGTEKSSFICENATSADLVIRNSYYQTSEITSVEDGLQGMTAQQFADGVVCYFLNNKSTADGVIWRQNFDKEDVAPSYVGDIVNKHTIRCKHHYDENNICTICGFEKTLPQLDGFYLISNANELNEFAKMVNGGESKINGRVINDIVLNENLLEDIQEGTVEKLNYWTCIGSSGDGFSGVFDGGNHTISGLYYNNTKNNVGFIAIANGAKVYDVHIKDAYFLGNIVGGICSEMSNGGSIDNCTFEGVVSGNYDVAGIVGSINNSTVNNCINKAQVLCRSSYAAGIAAYARGEVVVSGCENYGSVKIESEVDNIYEIGGIVASSESIEIRNCNNHGAIGSEEKRASYVAGILAYGGNQQSKIVNCYNDARITGRSDVSGIVGRFKGGEIVECKNEGVVDATSEFVAGICAEYDDVSSSTPEIVIVDCHNTADVTGTGYVGGVCGKISAYERKVKNCSNKGNVNSISGASVGGVIGHSEYASIVDCANEGNVSCLGEYGRQVGGIAGFCSAPILNCTNTAKVTNTGTLLYTGGICGRFEGGTIKNCHNSGDVESTTEYVAGLCGMITSGKIEDCSNTGRVSSETAKYYAGGLCGHSNEAAIINCFNTGDIYVPNTTIVGGLCGGSEGHSVRKSYNTGNITAAGCVGGLVGWIWRNSFIENCYNRGNVKALADSGKAAGLCCVTGGELAPSLKSSYSSGTISGAVVYPLVQNTNGMQSYYLAETNTADGGRVAELFADGTITTLLNIGHTGDAVWFQNENYPAFEGISVEVPLPEHLFDNGFCLFHENEYEPAVLNQTDGFYEIANVGQLYWFAQQVNDGNLNINGRLLADIIVNGNVPYLVSNGLSDKVRTWTPIRKLGCPYLEHTFYEGVFDGDNHVISGLYCVEEKSYEDEYCYSYVGLFGASKGTIKNVHVRDSKFSGLHAGGIVGETFNNALISHCSFNGEVSSPNGYAGGITSACSYSTCIKDCYNLGSVSGTSIPSFPHNLICNGGICGWVYAYHDEGDVKGGVFNCYNYAILPDTIYPICEIEAQSNCYYLSSKETPDGGRTKEQFADGTVTGLLNAGRTGDAMVWFQNDQYPDFVGETIIGLPTTDFLYVDGEATDVVSGIATQTVQYTRTDIEYNWGTLCLPFGFSASNCNGGSGVSLFDMSFDNGEVVLTQITNVRPGQPVLFYMSTINDLEVKVTVTGTSIKLNPVPEENTLIGTYTKKYIPSTDNNAYYIRGNRFWKGNGFTVKPFHAFFTGGEVELGTSSFRLALPEEAEQTEDHVLIDKQITAIYNIAGQRVERMMDKGVYILQYNDGTVQKIRFEK